MPDPCPGLPPMIFWRLASGVVLSSVYGPVADYAEARDHDGNQANHVVCRRGGRPFGAVAWMTHQHADWQPMATCPVPESVRDRREGGLPNGKAQQSKYGR